MSSFHSRFQTHLARCLVFLLVPVPGRMQDATAPVLSLADALARAASDNPSLAAHSYAQRAAEGLVEQAGLRPNPTLEFTAENFMGTGRVQGVRGLEATIRSPREAMALGLGLVPEDRKGQGLVLGMANRENGSLPSLPRFASRGVVDRARESAATGAAFAAMTMAADAEAATVTLSGGNQQKVVMAKWLTAESDLLILDEPTRGVDVGAKAELHAWIDRHAAAGGAVLLITSDMPELLNLATRILVLREGRPAGELARADATQASLLRLMSGLGAA